MTIHQARYLSRAIEIEKAYRYANGDSGIYWSIWVPGRTQTGRVCLREGWIVPFQGSGPGPFRTTAAGREALRGFASIYRRQQQQKGAA